MNVLFLEEAKREFLDAITYYGQAGVDLGLRFKNEVDQSIKWAARKPGVISASSWRISPNQPPPISVLRFLLCSRRYVLGPVRLSRQEKTGVLA